MSRAKLLVLQIIEGFRIFHKKCVVSSTDRARVVNMCMWMVIINDERKTLSCQSPEVDPCVI